MDRVIADRKISGSYKQGLEYLFYGEQPKSPGEIAQIMEVCAGINYDIAK